MNVRTGVARDCREESQSKSGGIRQSLVRDARPVARELTQSCAQSRDSTAGIPFAASRPVGLVVFSITTLAIAFSRASA
jgi:hypothetical protein